MEYGIYDWLIDWINVCLIICRIKFDFFDISFENDVWFIVWWNVWMYREAVNNDQKS